MKILVKVTKDVLKRSAHCKGNEINSHCAFALALSDLIPFATVGADYFNFGPFESVKQPVHVNSWISEFDERSPDERLAMPEISCEITLPDQLIDHIGISQAYRVLSESKTLELISI